MRRNTSRLISLLLILLMTLSLSAILSSYGNKETASQQTEASAEKTASQTDTSEDKNDAADKKDQAAKASKESDKASASSKSTKSSKSSSKKSGSKSGSKSGNKSGSSGSSDSKPSQPQAQTASITVDGYCSGKTVTLAEGDTVYDVLRKSGASLKTEKSVYGIYVVGINGLCEGDRGKASGWTYTLNGEMVMKSADKVTVSNGAVVKWTFVTNGL